MNEKGTPKFVSFCWKEKQETKIRIEVKPFAGLSCGASLKMGIFPDKNASSSKSLSSKGLFWSNSSVRGTTSSLPRPIY